MLVAIKKYSVIKKQLGELLCGDTITSHIDGLVIDIDDFGDPTHLHGILQGLDLQSVLVDV